METPERLAAPTRPPAAWRWLANTTTLGILGLGLLATAWRGSGLAAASVIVLAALVDGADGMFARRAGGPTRTGAVLDIAADFIAFGVAPAGLALAQASASDGSPAGNWPLAAVLGLYLAAALARLVRSARLVFAKPAGLAGLYVGLPMPTAGCLLAGLALSLPAGWVGAAALVISALAVSRRPYPSVPWLWQHRRASLASFVAVTPLVAALSPRAGLLLASAVCAAYPWISEVGA